MNTFHEYRVCKKRDEDTETDVFSVYTVHFNSLGEPMDAFDEPESPAGFTPEELRKDLQKMLETLQKPIIDLDTVQWAPLESELEYSPELPEKYLNLLIDRHVEVAWNEMKPYEFQKDPTTQVWSYDHPFYPIYVEDLDRNRLLDLYNQQLKSFILRRFKGELTPEEEAEVVGVAGLNFHELADQHLQIALEEIGEISPWFDEETESFMFEHDLYPSIITVGNLEEEVIEEYRQALWTYVYNRLQFLVANYHIPGKAGVHAPRELAESHETGIEF